MTSAPPRSAKWSPNKGRSTCLEQRIGRTGGTIPTCGSCSLRSHERVFMRSAGAEALRDGASHLLSANGIIGIIMLPVRPERPRRPMASLKGPMNASFWERRAASGRAAGRRPALPGLATSFRCKAGHAQRKQQVERRVHGQEARSLLDGRRLEGRLAFHGYDNIRTGVRARGNAGILSRHRASCAMREVAGNTIWAGFSASSIRRAMVRHWHRRFRSWAPF